MQRTDATANRLQNRTNFFRRFLFVCAFLAAAVQITSDISPFYKVSGSSWRSARMGSRAGTTTRIGTRTIARWPKACAYKMRGTAPD